ncbi:MAG: hypothetical protein RR603_02510 [Kurthia sp.]
MKNYEVTYSIGDSYSFADVKASSVSNLENGVAFYNDESDQPIAFFSWSVNPVFIEKVNKQ